MAVLFAINERHSRTHFPSCPLVDGCLDRRELVHVLDLERVINILVWWQCNYSIIQCIGTLSQTNLLQKFQTVPPLPVLHMRSQSFQHLKVHRVLLHLVLSVLHLLVAVHHLLPPDVHSVHLLLLCQRRVLKMNGMFSGGLPPPCCWTPNHASLLFHKMLFLHPASLRLKSAAFSRPLPLLPHSSLNQNGQNLTPIDLINVILVEWVGRNVRLSQSLSCHHRWAEPGFPSGQLIKVQTLKSMRAKKGMILDVIVFLALVFQFGISKQPSQVVFKVFVEDVRHPLQVMAVSF